MHLRSIVQVVGFILIIVGLGMIVPLIFSLYYHEQVTHDIGLSILICIGFGILISFLSRSKKNDLDQDISYKEGMAIVTLSWIFASVFGAIPFYISGYIPNYIDAFFETMSGFTTTGSSILTNIEALPKGLLMWRSFTHFLGGMGIIVLSLAILPFFNIGGMQLFKAETTGPIPDKLRPRIKDTAIILWKVYVLLCAIATILLMLDGMDLFDALCHAFGAIATGGYSTKNLSIGYYSPSIQVMITVFMYIGGINFSLHYKLLKGNFKCYFKDREFLFYTGFLAFMTISIAALTYGKTYTSILESLRHSAFQSVSILTATGYSTWDYEKWPFFAQFLLFVAMFVGGCAGSTAGGIKCIRILLLFKMGTRELKKIIHPRAVIRIKLNSRTISDEICHVIAIFFFLYLAVLTASTAILCLLGTDILTALSSTITCMGNVGPGFGTVGPSENFSKIPELGKLVLSFCMITGRLEIYPVLILFYPEFWKT